MHAGMSVSVFDWLCAADLPIQTGNLSNISGWHTDKNDWRDTQAANGGRL
jgi:hypothetical protein